MAMLPPATYAAAVAAATGNAALGEAFLTALFTQIQTMIKAETIAVPAVGLVAPAGGGPVTGAAVGTAT